MSDMQGVRGADVPFEAEPGSYGDAMVMIGRFRNQAKRYLEAVYGDAVWFRAPETFNNLTERWIWAVASGQPDFAEEIMKQIEELAESQRHPVANSQPDDEYPSTLGTDDHG